MIQKENKAVYSDINVKDLASDGFYKPYDSFDSNLQSTVKSLLADAMLSLITGLQSLPEKEIDGLWSLLEDEPRNCRPVFKGRAAASMEMAGFINGYCVRYADLCDTRRQTVGRGGHPADLIAALLAVCDRPEVNGKKLLEAIHTGYHMWACLQNGMMSARTDLDGTTALALVVPVTVGVLLGEDGETIQNAINLSAMGGPVAVEVRSSKVVTNCKCGATGYAVARALWCHRMSRFLQGTPTMFTGGKGWSKMVAPLTSEFKALSDDDVYGQIQFKAFPCCNANQVATESATHIHQRVADKLDHIAKIHIRVCEKDSTLAIRPGSPKYPQDHPSADHHIQFCTAVGLKYGTLAPKHYEEKHLQDEEVHHLIDLTEVAVLPEEERIRIGGENGAGELTVTMDDGTVYKEMLLRPCGLYIGFDSALRAEKMRESVQAKQEMIEKSYGFDLTPVLAIINDLENHSGQELLDTVLKAIDF